MERSFFRLSAVAIFAAFVLTACSTSHASTSRVELYDSAAEITDASALVVTGTVTMQRLARDIDDHTRGEDSALTISTILVGETIKGDVLPGDTIEVRQFGWGDEPAPTPIFTTDGAYLLYLTASGLPAPLDTQYYVTGASVGVYLADNEQPATASIYRALDPELDEGLPESITIAEAFEAAR